MALKITSRKYYRYLYLRLIRQKGSSHGLALSVSIGIFCGFVIPVFQMLLAVFLAWTCRVNKIVSVGCTWISNPFTYPILFPLNIYVGSLFIQSDFKMEELKKITLNTLFSDFGKVLKFFLSDGMLMFMIGGAICGIIAAALSYVSVFYTIRKYKRDKEERFYRRRQTLKRENGQTG